jgi:hypothetical protein
MTISWNERVLRADPYMSPATRGLVNLISKYFAATAFNRCAFYDYEAATLLGISSAALREAKNELLRKGFLLELPSYGRKPAYGLTCRQPAAFDRNETAHL